MATVKSISIKILEVFGLALLGFIFTHFMNRAKTRINDHISAEERMAGAQERIAKRLAEIVESMK